MQMNPIEYKSKAVVSKDNMDGEYDVVYIEIDNQAYSFNIEAFGKRPGRTKDEGYEWIRGIFERQMNEVAERARKLGRLDVQDQIKAALV
jgi:hypothetical protein